ncbi:MAG TPA: helix-turn-helix transcriptional regulator [Mycobacterium sp.]|nr:helix-turn-helix transcriptional regulator [Mycobacterium sp.]
MTKQNTAFVGTDTASAKLDKLRTRPGITKRAGEIRQQMAEADRHYAESLAAIRRAADLTQVELATQMGVAQSEISRIEKRHDMLLSTFTSYLTAAGVAPRVVITIDGQDIELDLTALTADQ